MNCKSALYAANTASQEGILNDAINFGSIVRKFGNGISLSGGNVTLLGTGFYEINTNITFTGAAGETTISVLKDGVQIPGATVTITTTADTSYSVSIPCIVRTLCCCESTITVEVTGIAATVENAAITVEKI